jgi:ABC-type transport system substrate-binding protein
MIEGSEGLDLSLPPEDQEPTAGFSTPGYVRKHPHEPWTVAAPGQLTLVRNPSWDPATDDLRAAYPDRIEVQLRGTGPRTPTVHTPYRATVEELAAAVEAGTVDLVPDLVYTSSQIAGYRADPEMRGRVATQPNEGVYFMVMNLALPPFDDLHVRRAVAYAIDTAELHRTMLADPKTRSIAEQAVVATHIAPDALEGDLLASYAPYDSSLERARQEMALSDYDRDGDGRCDARECRGMLALARDDQLRPAGADEVATWLAAIGIDLRVEFIPNPWTRIFDETDKVPLAMGAGFAQDFSNASTFLSLLFASWEIEGGYGANATMVGASPSQLRGWGYEVTKVPSVDDRIDRCMAVIGRDQTECWADLDRYLMEQVVAVVPYMATLSTYVVSKRVASYSFCVATFGLALDRMALVEGSD